MIIDALIFAEHSTLHDSTSKIERLLLLAAPTIFSPSSIIAFE